MADRRGLLAQIAAGDLDIAIIGKLSPPQLPLHDNLEPGALKVERLHAPLWRRALIEEALEDPPADPDSALVRSEDDAELDAGTVRC